LDAGKETGSSCDRWMETIERRMYFDILNSDRLSRTGSGLGEALSVLPLRAVVYRIIKRRKVDCRLIMSIRQWHLQRMLSGCDFGPVTYRRDGNLMSLTQLRKPDV